jgi:hypothetical protein
MSASRFCAPATVDRERTNMDDKKAALGAAFLVGAAKVERFLPDPFRSFIAICSPARPW